MSDVNGARAHRATMTPAPKQQHASGSTRTRQRRPSSQMSPNLHHGRVKGLAHAREDDDDPDYVEDDAADDDAQYSEDDAIEVIPSPIAPKAVRRGRKSTTTPVSRGPNTPRSAASTPGPNFNSRAHELKAALGPTAGIPFVNSRKRMPEHDPENYEIKRLRQDERLQWGDIARTMNEQRVKEGKVPTWTGPAVYGRFVRNGPRIAQMQGETFNPKDVS